MQDLAALRAVYVEIDAMFESRRMEAVQGGRAALAATIDDKQRINDQAYFVLCWGQLETAIDDHCRSAIRRRLSSPDWEERRAWDLYDPDERRLSGLRFEHRVALVLDRQGGSGSAWARVLYYYALRNQIAHGRLLSDRIDVPTVVNEFYQIQGALST